MYGLSSMPGADAHLRTLQAVERVLAREDTEVDAYPALLAAIGGELGWTSGLWWMPEGDGPDVPAGNGATVVLPVRANERTLAVLEFAGPEPDETTYALLEMLGGMIGRFAALARARRSIRDHSAR